VSLSVNTVNSISDIPAAEWNSLTADTLYNCHRWLAFVERDTNADCRYVTVKRGGELMAAIPVYRVRKEENDFYDPRNLVDGRWGVKHLIVGTRRGYVNTFPINDGLIYDERRRILATLLGEVEREAAGDGALLLYMPGTTADELASIRPGVAPLLTSMDACLTLRGSGFDDYLSGLHKQARTNVRREIAAYQAADVITGFARIGECCDEAAPLLQQLQERYGHGGDEKAYRRMLRGQAEILDDMSLVITARRGGRLIGFALFYLWGNTMYLRMAGFDYAMLDDAFEYFNLAFYLPIKWAYEHGFSQLHLGRESYDAKVRRGARLRPLLSAGLPAMGGCVSGSERAWNRHQLEQWQSVIGPSRVDGGEWARWAD
jgi:uncharacterized protein